MRSQARERLIAYLCLAWTDSKLVMSKLVGEWRIRLRFANTARWKDRELRSIQGRKRCSPRVLGKLISQFICQGYLIFQKEYFVEQFFAAFCFPCYNNHLKYESRCNYFFLSIQRRVWLEFRTSLSKLIIIIFFNSLWLAILLARELNSRKKSNISLTDLKQI